MNAVGDRMELAYERAGNILPNLERVQVATDDWVEFTAAYDLAYGAIIHSTDPNGHTWRMTLDGLGRITEIFDPIGTLPVSKFEYTYGTPEFPISTTRIDQLIERTGRYHSSWSYSDGAGRARQQKETAESPHGYVASSWTTLSSRGKPIAVYDPFFTPRRDFEAPSPATPVTLTNLDALGRPITVHRPPTEDLPGGSVTLTQYFPFETHAYTEKESTDGDLEHPVITRMDGLGRVVEVEKLNTVRGELQHLLWRIGYDTRGSITTFGDPQWNGQLNDTRHLRHYTYDSLGRLVTVQDPNAGTTDYTFDDLGRVTFRRDPLGQFQEWIYRKAGRLHEHRVGPDATNAPSYVHRYHYDVPAPDTPLTFGSNLRGKLAWLEFPTGDEHYAYDALGRVTEEALTLWNPSTSSFADQDRDVFYRNLSYRADGNVTQTIAPGGLRLDYGYNERNAVTSLSSTISSLTTTAKTTRSILDAAAYDHRGAVVRSDFGNGTRSCNTFNDRGELTSFRAGKTADVDCGATGFPSGGYHNLRYRRAHDGLIDAIDDLSATNTGLPRLDAAYEYDAIQQLTGVTDPRGTTTYTYDTIQNLVQREIIDDIQDRPVGEFGYGVDAGPNAITHAGGETYTYDAAGQMERYNGYDLHFDAEGRLVEANNTTTGVRLVQHYDDAGERRIALVYRTGKPVEVHRFVAPEYQIRDGEEVWFAGGGSAGAEIVRSKGVLVDAALLDQLTQYVNGVETEPKPLPEEYMDLNGDGVAVDAADLAVAEQGYVSGERVGGEKLVWKYTTTDHLGGTTHQTDSAGDLISHQRFHAYGKVASRRGARSYRGYIGKDIEADLDLGLQRIGARYYAPALGRWVTPDPLIGQEPGLMATSPLESGLYSYALNNPIVLMDPTGLEGEATESTSQGQGSAQGISVSSDDEVIAEYASKLDPGKFVFVDEETGQPLSHDDVLKRAREFLERDVFINKELSSREKYAFSQLQPDTRDKFMEFRAKARAWIYDNRPGWELDSNGSGRKFSNEVERGKKATVPFMHYAGLAQDYQPVVGGKMIDTEVLKTPEFQEYNKAMADVARSVGLKPGFDFNHPEHFEDRRGSAYTRALQERAESGAFGLQKTRDRVISVDPVEAK